MIMDRLKFGKIYGQIGRQLANHICVPIGKSAFSARLNNALLKHESD